MGARRSVAVHAYRHWAALRGTAQCIKRVQLCSLWLLALLLATEHWHACQRPRHTLAVHLHDDITKQRGRCMLASVECS